MNKLYYITGVSGSGKSSVLKALQDLGHVAHGVDEEGFADWHNKTTGLIDPFPHDDPNLDMHQWYKDHDWILSPERIGKLKDGSENKPYPVFLCGVAGGEDKVWHLFDKVFSLIIDADTIRHRIKHRTNNEFGKSSEELEHILDWHSGYTEVYTKFGAVLIDATKPLDEVVDEILSQVEFQ